MARRSIPPIIIMGVQGSGKSTIGRLLAQRLGAAYIDGDSLHSMENREWMASGRALSDAQRLPWLHDVGERLTSGAEGGVVVSCSALKRSYRDLLRDHAPTMLTVFASGDPSLIRARLAARRHEYMPPSLLQTQLDELEVRQDDEPGLTVDITQTPEDIVERIMMGETGAWPSAPGVMRTALDPRPMSEGITMTERRPARKRATAGTRGPDKLDETARVHPYRTLQERIARGLAWRETAPIESHAVYGINRRRRSPVGILRAQDDARVKDLVPIRYGRMSDSAFKFYRGSAAIMAYDLASQKWTPGDTQICGDAHLSNFGVFASPERDLVFDVNDFDETLPGPFEWDVKRLVVSFVLAARDRGFKRKEARVAVREALQAYRWAIAELAQMGTLDIWYTKIDEQELLSAIAEMGKGKVKVKAKALKSATEKATANFDAARRKTSMKAARKLTEVVDGHQQFREEPPLLSRQVITDEYRDRVQKAFWGYRSTLQDDRRRLLERFHLVDMAQKVVGVGSVGTRAGILLLQGRSDSDPLILQFKEATTSVLEPYIGASTASQHGQRVVEGQRYMQAASDIFLGWVRGEGGRDFYVRQLHDMKGSADIETIQPMALTVYARLCGATLARAHARGGDAIAIDAYIGADESFIESLEEFAQVYADQAEQDYGQLKQAIADGKIPVQAGV